MIEDRVRDDLAFIREAIEDGSSYATRCGPAMVVWGIAIAIGQLGTYAYVRGYAWAMPPGWLWTLCIGLAWVYSLRRLPARMFGAAPAPRHTPMVAALRMAWLGCGIFLSTLTLAALWSGGGGGEGWLNAVVAGSLGGVVFVTAWLAGLPWLRWVAVAWWIGEQALFALRYRPAALLLSAALMLALLAGPGLVLVVRRHKLAAA